MSRAFCGYQESYHRKSKSIFFQFFSQKIALKFNNPYIVGPKATKVGPSSPRKGISMGAKKATIEKIKVFFYSLVKK